MKKNLVLTILIAPLLLALGCSARSKPSALETKLANAAKDVVIPLEAQNKKNPTPATELTLAQGRQSFLTHCALCHGSDGKSQNPLGLAMYPPAMDLTSPHVQAWKDAELYWIINNGIRLTGMPGWHSMISSDDIWKLTRYVHALPKMTPAEDAKLAALVAPPPPPAAGSKATAKGEVALAEQIAYGKRLLHQEDCIMCHKYEGEGGTIGPDLSTEGTRGRTDAWLIGHFRDPAKYSPGSVMPDFKNLTQPQLNALVAMLQNSKSAPKPAPKSKR
ncbi:MAG: c-type cytochrome [Acidobacteria bacterium]|nr:MAG: c-type cytochrome [Acidobacteriota bacterium]